jgi:molybdopterin molybdotransferase
MPRPWCSERAHRSEPVEVDLADAAGLVLAADVVAAEQVPPFANSAVDGYAVIAPISTWPARRARRGGRGGRRPAPPTARSAGEAIRIMTGAPMPPGADAVVMVEDSERVGDDRVLVKSAVAGGCGGRPAGDDVQPGDLLFEAGTVVRPAGARRAGERQRAASRIVHRRACGSRCCRPATSSSTTAARSSRARSARATGRCSRACSRDLGCEVVDLGIVADDEDELERCCAGRPRECDAIVSSGGVSMGDYDVVKAVLGRIADMHWMQIAIKPAKPFAFGPARRHADLRVAGQPGQLARQLRDARAAGAAPDDGPPRLARPSVVAIADDALARRPDGKVHLVRARGVGDDGRCARRARHAPRAAISSPRPHWPTRSPWSPTATASPPAPRSPS